MKKLLLLPLWLLAFEREAHIAQIDAIIEIYKKRLACLERHEALTCIRKYPLDKRNDALAKSFALGFPSSFYRALLRRNLDILEKEKLCYGRASSEAEARACLKNLSYMR